MTVNQLIKELKGLDKNCEVGITTYNDGYDSCIIVYDNPEDADNQTLIYI
jgi:hypothetical protein